jgi:hypothetical protein
MNTLLTTTIYQTEDCQLNLHFIVNEDKVEHYFEAITPSGIFIDDNFLIGNIYVVKSMEGLLDRIK